MDQTPGQPGNPGHIGNQDNDNHDNQQDNNGNQGNIQGSVPDQIFHNTPQIVDFEPNR